MSTEELIEVAAKAMFDASVHWHECLTWDNAHDGHRDLFRKYARAAYPVFCKELIPEVTP